MFEQTISGSPSLEAMATAKAALDVVILGTFIQHVAAVVAPPFSRYFLRGMSDLLQKRVVTVAIGLLSESRRAPVRNLATKMLECDGSEHLSAAQKAALRGAGR